MVRCVVEAMAGIEKRNVAKMKMALTPAAAKTTSSAGNKGLWLECLTDQRTIIHQEVLSNIGHSLGPLLSVVGYQHGSEQ